MGELLEVSKARHHLFPLISGNSTAVFIRSVRLQYAKELIQSSDKSISEIAYDVGFNDPSWFSRAFKEEFGFSPSDTSK